MTEGRTKQTLNASLPFYGGGIKKLGLFGNCFGPFWSWPFSYDANLNILLLYFKVPLVQFSKKIMKRYPIFSVQIINHQIDQMHK